MNVTAIRDELRESAGSGGLARQRRLSTLAAVGAVDFAIISLYQLGVIRHLPDPPGKIFDSDKVNASTSAYRFGVPDGPLGLAMYAAVLALAGAGGSERTDRHPIWDLALGATVAGGVIGAAGYLYEMIRKQKVACGYCLVGAAINFAMVPAAVGAVHSAARALRRRT
jgi:uncharacterized membrane protein